MNESLKPRWTPMWSPSENGQEILIGHAGELDVYYEDIEEEHGDSENYIFIVGPREKVTKPGGCNFDSYMINNNTLQPYGNMDLHVDLAEMCEVYRIVASAGYIRTDE